MNQAPIVVPVNTDEGYVINRVTGDSIRPLLNAEGDPIITGAAIPSAGKKVHPGSIVQPAIVPAGKPKMVSVQLNEFIIPETLAVIPLDTGSLKTFIAGTDGAAHPLINSTGDTLSTAVPIPIAGKVTPCLQPQPAQALLPRMKDNASISIKYLDVVQGMNSSQILSILEDIRGNMWFGTGGGGVCMFNGESFTHYTKEEGLSNNQVWSILEDSKGMLWFGTWGGGVTSYDGENFMHFTESEGLSSNRIRSILEDSQGNLWFSTWGAGICKYNGRTITRFTREEGLSDNRVNAMYEDSQGNLWFCTENAGVSRYDGKSFTHLTQNDGLSSNRVLSVLEDSRGALWFGTGGGGLSRYRSGSITHFTEKDGLSNNIINSIFEDSRGNIWFGTDAGGLSLYDGKKFKYYTEDEGLSNNTVKAIFEDSHGSLWFGTAYGGVNMLNGNSFSHFNQKVDIHDHRVRSIMEDSKGNIWFGPWNGGASRYDGTATAHFNKEEGLTDHSVLCIYEDSRGYLWFGTEGAGAVMYDGKTFAHYTREVGLSSDNVRSILEDSSGNIWFGTFGGGVSMFNGKNFTHFAENEGLSNPYILSILEDRLGNLWFGTFGGGVSMYNGVSLTHLTEKEGLSNNNVLSLLEDSHGNIWFGTYGGGVTVYDGNTFIHFTEEAGLSHNTVQSILEDGNQNMWVSTEKGLNLMVIGRDGVHPGQNDPVIHTYGLQDGLKGVDFLLNRALLDSQNRIWWGNSRSLVILDMNNHRVPEEPPVLHLNRLEINDRFTDYRNSEPEAGIKMKFDSVARYYNYPLNLELPYRNNDVAFYFSALDWAAPHKLKYSYKLEGLHSNWSAPSSESMANFRGLSYGDYTFKVRAIGGAQKWSEPFEYTFTINPPWWHTWWARSGYAIALIGIIIGAARWRTASLTKRKKELEAQVANATLIIREQKEEVEAQRDEIEIQKEEIENQRDEVIATNEALQNQKMELEQTLENLKLIQSQLIQSEKMASVGVLTAGIAHELNNPINFVSSNVNPLLRDVNDVFTVIRKYEEIIKSKSLEGSFSEVDQLKDKLDFAYLIKEIMSLLKGIEEGAIRTSQIVKGLRSFSRLDEEKWERYHIHEGIESSLILLQNKIKNRITIRKEFGELEPIECYPGKLNQVFMNVLTNSIQAIEATGEISIQTLSTGKVVKAIFRDSGRGMTPEVKKHIFEPFYTTKDVGEGTGLGLSITYGIVEQHHGTIEVLSETGKGSEFIISLPKTQPGKE